MAKFLAEKMKNMKAGFMEKIGMVETYEDPVFDLNVQRFRELDRSLERISQRLQDYLTQLTATCAASSLLAQEFNRFYEDAIGSGSEVARLHEGASQFLAVQSELDRQSDVLSKIYMEEVLHPITALRDRMPNIEACIQERQEKLQEYEKIRAKVKALQERPSGSMSELNSKKNKLAASQAALNEITERLYHKFARLEQQRPEMIKSEFMAFIGSQVYYFTRSSELFQQLQPYFPRCAATQAVLSGESAATAGEGAKRAKRWEALFRDMPPGVSSSRVISSSGPGRGASGLTSFSRGLLGEGGGGGGIGGAGGRPGYEEEKSAVRMVGRIDRAGAAAFERLHMSTRPGMPPGGATHAGITSRRMPGSVSAGPRGGFPSMPGGAGGAGGRRAGHPGGAGGGAAGLAGRGRARPGMMPDGTGGGMPGGDDSPALPPRPGFATSRTTGLPRGVPPPRTGGAGRPGMPPGGRGRPGMAGGMSGMSGMSGMPAGGSAGAYGTPPRQAGRGATPGVAAAVSRGAPRPGMGYPGALGRGSSAGMPAGGARGRSMAAGRGTAGAARGMPMVGRGMPGAARGMPRMGRGGGDAGMPGGRMMSMAAGTREPSSSYAPPPLPARPGSVGSDDGSGMAAGGSGGVAGGGGGTARPMSTFGIPSSGSVAVAPASLASSSPGSMSSSSGTASMALGRGGTPMPGMAMPGMVAPGGAGGSMSMRASGGVAGGVTSELAGVLARRSGAGSFGSSGDASAYSAADGGAASGSGGASAAAAAAAAAVSPSPAIASTPAGSAVGGGAAGGAAGGGAAAAGGGAAVAAGAGSGAGSRGSTAGQRMQALFSFKAQAEDELQFEAGDWIVVVQKDTSGWWYGSMGGKSGFFPSSYVSSS